MFEGGAVARAGWRAAERGAAEVGRTSWLHRLPFAVRAVLRRWRGLLGMVVGIGIALGLGMTLMATSRASIDWLVGDYRATGAELFVHAQGGTLLPLLPGETTGKVRHAGNVLSQLRGLPGVRAAVGVVTWPLERERPGPRRRADQPAELVSTVGVDGEPAEIPGTVLLKAGRWIGRADEAVVGARLAREKHLALGDTLRLNERDFQIVGIGRLRGIGLGSDGFAYVEYRALRQRTALGDVVHLVLVDTTRPELVRERIPELGSLVAETPDELIGQVDELMRTAIAMQAILVGLTLVIAGLFVGNMLARSVTARRLELATLRAIGVPSRTIVGMIAGEALLVSSLASGVGIAVSLGIGWLIDRYLAPMYGIESLYVADAWLFLSVALLALALGLLAAIVPARRATRVDPVEVLREA